LPSRLLAAALLCLATAAPAEAKVFYSQKEALELAFPDAERIEKRTELLDDAKAEEVQQLAQAELPSRLVTLYTGYRGDTVLGHAVIEIHTVRTQPEAFLVVISPEGQVRSIRVLAFYEPQEYLPPERWFRQFDGRRLDERLRLEGDIHGIAGSTLSSRAVTAGVRRALAVYRVLAAPPPDASSPKPAGETEKGP
jgi:Na+-translocating ferredoxin:NAD+ oxidoreductase RnfG subunit